LGRVSGGRGRQTQKTSKSRKRKGSKGSRHRFGSIYKDSESSDAQDDVSDNFSQFNRANSGRYGLVNGFYTKQTATSVGIAAANIALVDAETSQDIERLCREIEAYEKKFDD